MKSIILVSFLTVFLTSCDTTQSKNVDSSSPTAVTPTIQESNKSPKLPSPTPFSTPIGIKTPIEDTDYSVTAFDYGKMTKSLLGGQPMDIIEKIGLFDPASRKHSNPAVNLEEELKPIKKIKIKTADYDLNHDGVAERAVTSRREPGDGLEALSIFRLENDKWLEIFGAEGDPDYPTLPKVEFLRDLNKGGFDLIKEIIEIDANKDLKDIIYYQMQNGQYKPVECYWAEGSVKKSVSCNPSERYK